MIFMHVLLVLSQPQPRYRWQQSHALHQHGIEVPDEACGVERFVESVEGLMGVGGGGVRLAVVGDDTVEDLRSFDQDRCGYFHVFRCV